MALIKFTNFAHSTLASGITNVATSLAVAAGQGARFPSLGAGEYFYVTLEDASLNREIVKVTARSTDTFTIVRAQDNTAARAWVAGDVVSLRLNAAAISEVTALEDGSVTQAKLATALSNIIVYTDTDQTLTGSKRGAITTDNDLSFDMNAANNFSCTPTGAGTLTFTNITAGQSGFIKLVNGSNYTISAAATTKINATDLTTISATGTYILSYFSDGTNVYVMVSRNVA